MGAKIRIGQYDDLRELARKSHDLKRAGFHNMPLTLPRSWSGAKQMVVLKRPFLLGRVDEHAPETTAHQTLVWVNVLSLQHTLEKLGFYAGGWT
jgi:hypothetical protein